MYVCSFSFLERETNIRKSFEFQLYETCVSTDAHAQTQSDIFISKLLYLMITHVIGSRYVWFSSINWYSENLFQVLLHFKLRHLTWECSQEVSLLHDVLWNQHMVQTKLKLVLDKQTKSWSTSGWPEWMCHMLLWVIDDLS